MADIEKKGQVRDLKLDFERYKEQQYKENQELKAALDLVVAKNILLTKELERIVSETNVFFEIAQHKVTSCADEQDKINKELFLRVNKLSDEVHSIILPTLDLENINQKLEDLRIKVCPVQSSIMCLKEDIEEVGNSLKISNAFLSSKIHDTNVEISKIKGATGRDFATVLEREQDLIAKMVQNDNKAKSYYQKPFDILESKIKTLHDLNKDINNKLDDVNVDNMLNLLHEIKDLNIDELIDSVVKRAEKYTSNQINVVKLDVKRNLDKVQELIDSVDNNAYMKHKASVKLALESQRRDVLKDLARLNARVDKLTANK